MSSFCNATLSRITRTRLAHVGIRAPFTIPSGIVTTVPSVLARIARDVDEIGFLTTKTISVKPREGYREPVLHEYYPGCFVNAVGLANPGADAFLRSIKPLLPLHDNKPLFISIMGETPEEFLECARIVDPVADAFELNFSCPHVKGAGQSVGSDHDAVRRTIGLLKGHLGKPVIPKLSPNLGDIPAMARLCEREGADALTLINTVGPGLAVDAEGDPILSNELGGLSGSGVRPLGLKSVREAAGAVTIPIIASGGIATAQDVIAYQRAGAMLYSVGSALAGMTTSDITSYFKSLVEYLEQEHYGFFPSHCPSSGSRTGYLKTMLRENRPIGPNLFKLALEDGPACRPGSFFFLRLPGVGEKPFSPAMDIQPEYIVRTVGPFTRALEHLKPGDPIFMRGPYGNGFPHPDPGRPLVLLGGGTGAAPVMMAAKRWPGTLARGFFGFSEEVDPGFRDEILGMSPSCSLVIDSPGSPGEVVRALERDIKTESRLYAECRVYMCGPEAMMRAASAALQERVPIDRIFAAREDIMRCGIGICGSCGTPSGLRSCVDGPVMAPDFKGE
ncbi:MAG: tRNA-dihydrouridine synthase [Deltaproteobacteria bacterium]